MALKRLLKKLLLFILPFVLLFCGFFCFETYDYFALQKNPQYQIEPLSAMRYAKLRRPERVIFGDSRMANLDVDYIRELTGEDYTRLAWGGAQTGESIDLFWYAVQYCDFKQVIFGINFYTSKATQVGDTGRYDAIGVTKPFADSVFKFSTNMYYWLKAIVNVKQLATNPIYRALGREDLIALPENPPKDVIIPDPALGEKWRLNMEEYADAIQLGMEEYEFEQATYDALQEVIDYCGANDIELIFVLPPVHEVMYERVVAVNGMEADLQGIKDFLIAGATVYDFEIRSDFTSDPDTFYDGFHLMLENKLLFARLLFTDTAEHPEIVRRYIKDGAAIIPEHRDMAYEIN